MSGLDDYDSEMFRRRSLDDMAVEDLLTGRDPGQADLTMLVGFLADVRAAAHGHAPDASPALAALMADGLSTDDSDRSVRAANNIPGPGDEVAGTPKRKTAAILQTLVGLRLRAKAAIGLGVAAVAITGAGAAGALPGPAQHAVADTLNSVTPFHFPDGANSHAEFGKTTSSDATGTSDGQPGVDGQSIAGTAPDNGLHVARNTPAGDHVPTSVPVSSQSSGRSGEPPENSTDSNDPSSPSSNAPDDPGQQSSNAPDDPGQQSSNGITTASTTPAGSHVPTQVPPPHP